jgi:hypothetical protein
VDNLKFSQYIGGGMSSTTQYNAPMMDQQSLIIFGGKTVENKIINEMWSLTRDHRTGEWI